MGLDLPSELVKCLSRTRVSYNDAVTEEKLWLYVQSSPEDFNAMVTDHVKLIHARYGFSAPEHGDWVYPACCCFAGAEGISKSTSRPLNSWDLKEPFTPVPSLGEIRQQHEWRQEYIRATAGNKNRPSLQVEECEAEDLQEQHVGKVCAQLADYTILLVEWRNAGGPREQEDCLGNLDRKQMKSILNAQRRTMLDAKKIMEGFRLLYAPTFMIENATATYMREQVLCEQIRHAMRFC